MSEADWTIQKVLNWTTQHFGTKEIPSPRLDAEVLLSKVMKCSRLELYLKFDQPISSSERAEFKEFVRRRAAYEPVAYILGEKEFYGRPFKVGSGVLIPRPETEHIVDEALAWAKTNPVTNVLDIATGSGILAATLATELPQAALTAIDVSPEALSYAKKNFETLGLSERITVVENDFVKWAATSEEKFDLIVANPPYISSKAELMNDVKDFEPGLALYGGEAGSEILLQWLPVMISKLNNGGMILCEMGFDQKKIVEESLPRQGISLSFIKDYSEHDRIIKIIKA